MGLCIQYIGIYARSAAHKNNRKGKHRGRTDVSRIAFYDIGG